MNINTSKSYYYTKLLKESQVNKLINTTKKNKSIENDTFSYQHKVEINKSHNYSEFDIKNNMVDKEILDALNFGNVESCDDIYTYKGINFTSKQLFKVPTSWCKDITAKNNVVTFDNNSYYKYIDTDGTSHCIVSRSNHLISSLSDLAMGNSDHVSYRTSWFWNIMSSKGSAYISTQFTHDEQKEYLDCAGIKKGLFTVKVGNDIGEHYRSEGDILIHPKWEYDEQYSAMSEIGLFFDNTPGDIFTVDNKEYALSENHTLDIPYGIDIFNIQYPHKKF